MLKSLSTAGVGPAPEFSAVFGQRLNVITGDNGLGKSFLLDVAWWVCAHDWPDEPALPSPSSATGTEPVEPTLSAEIEGIAATANVRFRFEPEFPRWRSDGPGRPPIPGLVLYGRIDGRFSVWDPARHYFRNALKPGIDEPDRLPAFHFNRTDIWNGKRDDQGRTISRGLLVDWREWQLTKADEFKVFENVLASLAPGDEPIRIASEPVRLPGPAVDRIPALEMPFGLVPVTLASSAMKRIIALAYLMVWMWSEHSLAARTNHLQRQRQIIVILDEVEAHLHPQWQRRILPALLEVDRLLGGEVGIQFIVSTHSPLVLASLEPAFDGRRDRLLHLRLEGGSAVLEDMNWLKRGSSAAWLRSEVFGLDQDRSVPASKALRRADDMMRQTDGIERDVVEALEAELAHHLAGTDPFWAQWHRFRISRSLGEGR